MSEAERKKQLLYEIENNDKEIEYRDQMATRIVNDLQTIGDMMKDLDNLVKTQQPMLDCIEANIDSVCNDTAVAVVELREAKANQSSCIIS